MNAVWNSLCSSVTATSLKAVALLTFAPCSSLQTKAHGAGTVVTILHHARWTATACAVLQYPMVTWTPRSRTGAQGNCGSQGSCYYVKEKEANFRGN